MSTSDSDYSIDWLASDEDDYGSPTRLSPQHAEEFGAAGQEVERLHWASTRLADPNPQSSSGINFCLNEQFSQKCTELQCYIQSLSDILQGLRSGRYSERFSSFQESVAMDRIQRIMGVLQNPNMGGRFLSIVLKIAEMLHSWFPHIRPDPTHTEPCTPAKTAKAASEQRPPPCTLPGVVLLLRLLHPPQMAPHVAHVLPEDS
nr:circadian-associated transcriptional repressor-like [Pseudochaenichthys georgianus]